MLLILSVKCRLIFTVPVPAQPTLETESKLNCFLVPEPQLRIAAPAPFYLLRTCRNFGVKYHGC
jgi:hypothetical protein